MAKKKVSPKKKKAPSKPARKPARKLADRSRIDTKPLQEHIRKRIDALKQGATARTGTPDDTISRLQIALDTLREICYPAMDVPI